MREEVLPKKEYDNKSVDIVMSTPSDAEIICDIRDRAWIDAYPNPELGITPKDIEINAKGLNGEFVPRRIAGLKDELATPNRTMGATFVAKIDGKVIGFVNPSIEDDKRRIGAIYVTPEEQGSGVGGKLMKQALDWHGRDENIYLDVIAYNDNAINFYKKFGFEQTDTIVAEEPNRPDFMKSLPVIEMVLKAEAKEWQIQKEMTSQDVVNIVTLCDENGIEAYVDGGWGVDALLGEQTRKHGDLDIALPHKHVPKLRELLAERGFKKVSRDDTRDCNFVLGDDKGHEVDFHSYTFDENGNNVFGVAYEPRHLTGTGTINGYPVKCIPADVMVEFHSGYEFDDDDYHDVKALCEKFGIALPVEYKKFEEQK